MYYYLLQVESEEVYLSVSQLVPKQEIIPICKQASKQASNHTYRYRYMYIGKSNQSRQALKIRLGNVCKVG